MNYKLTEVANGETQFIRKAGSAFVKATMPIGKAEGIIGTGKVKESDKFDGFPIAVNDEYYFPGELAEEEDKPYRDEGNDHFKKNKWNK